LFNLTIPKTDKCNWLIYISIFKEQKIWVKNQEQWLKHLNHIY